MGVLYLGQFYAILLFQRRAKADIKGVYLSGDIAHNKKSVSYKKYAPQGLALFLGKDGECGKRRLFFRRAYDCKCGV